MRTSGSTSTPRTSSGSRSTTRAPWYDFGDRIFHAHAKDLEIRREGLYRHGTFSGGIGWQVPRLPGLGEVDWSRFVAALYSVGYDHVLSVEHEDRNFEQTPELVERGFVLAHNTLKPLLV